MQKLISKPLPTLLQPGVLNKLLINNNNFNKDFRILETNFGPAKEDYDKCFLNILKIKFYFIY